MGTAALIRGLTLFIPAAPYAEFYVFLDIFTQKTQPFCLFLIILIVIE